MKRFFASDAESDMLIAEATKTFGLKIGDNHQYGKLKISFCRLRNRSARRKIYLAMPYRRSVGSSGNQAVDDARY